MRASVVVVALLFAGCQKTEAPPAEARPAVSAAPAPVAASAVTSAVVSARPAVSASGLPPGVPGDKAASAKATTLNARALKDHQAGSHDAAAKGFEEAVRVDPSHVLARYNLACALAKKGDAERVLGVLADLARAAECDDCKRQLAFARQDPDLASLLGDVRFAEMTSRAAVGPLPPKAVVGAVTRAIATGDDKAAGPFVRPDSKVKIAITDSLAQEGERATRTETKEGPAALTRFAKLLNGATPGDRLNFEPMIGPACDATCCRSKPTMLNHHMLVLTRVCVEHDEQGRAWVTEVGLIDGD